MGWKTVLTFTFVVIVIALLIIYWFVPIGEINFNSDPNHSNFSVGNSSSMQFYDTMRFPSSSISYKIYECGLKKKNDIEDAFYVVSQQTSLSFNHVSENEEISIACSERVKMDEGLFIAGEGGPTKIIQTDRFNVILKGKVLLIRDSKCQTPNVAIHELLHVLGFDHSKNKKNVMYYMSECGQTIGDDIINLINELYKAPTSPDLAFGNVSASVSGTYLDFEINVKNNGLAVSEPANINVYADNKLVKELGLKELEIGTGLKISLDNLWMAKRNPDQLKFVIETDFTEIDKVNNELVLSI
jgi:archaellum component FlaF (FlaF/FlaG flagellin family)